MTTLPEEAVKAAAQCYLDRTVSINETASSLARAMLTAAAPHLAAVRVKKLEWELASGDHYAEGSGTHYNIYETRPDFWNCVTVKPGNVRLATNVSLEAAKAAAQADYEARIIAALEPAATCNESLQVEPAAPEAQLAAFLNDLSGENGELIDRMAAAIRDWGSHYDDGPWETLPEDRKAGWRGDAKRALEVVKEYLTTRALSSPDHADAGKVEEVKLPTERVCIPDPHNFGARIVGFRIREGDDAWGETGLSEPISWLNKLLTPNAGKVEGDGWLPIESAPKDGTVIQAWHQVHKCPVSVLWKDDGFPYRGERLNWHERTYTTAWPERAFTHWRPLPSAPASEGAE